MTALDFIGVYDPLTRLKTMGFRGDVVWDICAFTQEVRDGAGLQFVPTRVGKPLGDYDMVIIPGGFSTRDLLSNQAFIEWMRTAAPCTYKVSVCTGALLSGAAGFLKGRRATTHLFDAGELLTALRERGVQIGAHTSVIGQLWDRAEIFPVQRNPDLVLTEEQRRLLALFG